MNLNGNPTPEELAALLGACDDDEATHIIWVDLEANVHVTPLNENRALPKNRTRMRSEAATPRPLTPAGWIKENKDRVLFRLEACVRGAGQTGDRAAKDLALVNRFHALLVKHWRLGSRGLVDSA